MRYYFKKYWLKEASDNKISQILPPRGNYVLVWIVVEEVRFDNADGQWSYSVFSLLHSFFFRCKVVLTRYINIDYCLSFSLRRKKVVFKKWIEAPVSQPIVNRRFDAVDSKGESRGIRNWENGLSVPPK